MAVDVEREMFRAGCKLFFLSLSLSKPKVKFHPDDLLSSRSSQRRPIENNLKRTVKMERFN